MTKEGWWQWGNSNNGAEQVIAPEEASAGDWQIISALIHPSNGTSLYVDGRLVGRHVGSYDGSSGGTLLVLSGTYNLMRGGVYGDLAEMIAYSSGDANAELRKNTDTVSYHKHTTSTFTTCTFHNFDS